jgi:cytoskeleton protein RodZ
MISVGETLRRERLRRNLDLNQISQELRISTRFLEAIEDEQFDRLPAGVFAKSFVRQYARILDLDEEELAREVQRTLAPESNPAAANHPQSPLPDIHVPRVEQWDGGMASGRRFSWSSSLPALAMVVVAMLVCSGVYSWWQRSRHSPAAPTAEAANITPAQTPAARAVQPVAASPSEARPPQEPAASTQPSAQSAARTETASAAPASARAPAAAQPAQGADRVAESAGRTPVASGPVHVELSAQEAVWILVQRDGKYLFSGTMEPNTTRTVDANGVVTLRMGNAGGLNISLNGKELGAVGPRGQVRTVQFTSGGFHIVPGPKSPDLLDERF